MKTMILYYSRTGHTLEAANAIAKGIRATGSEADIVSVDSFRSSMLKAYETVIIGSPCWAGSVGSTGAASPVVKALKNLAGNSLDGKLCGGFAVHARTGGDTTVSHIGRLVSQKGCRDFREGPVAAAGTLMSVVKGKSVSAADLKRYQAYGSSFAG